jgi:hypothetical protein
MFDTNIALSQAAREHATTVNGQPDSFLDHVLNYPLAVVGELGETVINSGIGVYNFFAPEVIELDHIDDYAFMTSSVEEYARRHEAAVEFGSFTAGLLLPGLGVTKAFQAARQGSTGFGMALRGLGVAKFSDKAQMSVKAAKALAEKQGIETLAYKQALRSGQLWTVADATAENLVFEATALALLNQHSYYEESMNPYLFAIGLGVGTGITSVVNWSSLRAGLMADSTLQAAEKGIASNYFEAAVPTQISISYGAGTGLEVLKGTLAKVKGAQAADTVASTEASKLKDFFNLQFESAAAHQLNRLATPALRETKQLRSKTQPMIKPWEIPEQQFTKVNPPDEYRLMANKLMAEGNQAVGFTYADLGISVVPFEAKVAPWEKTAEGHRLVDNSEETAEILAAAGITIESTRGSTGFAFAPAQFHTPSGYGLLRDRAVIDMRIDDFIALTKREVDSADERLQSLRKLEEPTADGIPQLDSIARLDMKEVNGVQQVDKSDGLRRARVFKERGYTHMPVEVYASDNLESWPVTLYSTKGVGIDVGAATKATAPGVVRPAYYPKLDRAAKVWLDNQSGEWVVDITGIRNSTKAVEYIAHQMHRKGTRVRVVDETGRDVLGAVYKKAMRQVNANVMEAIAKQAGTIHEAADLMPKFAAEMSVVRWFDGKAISQGSIAAFMTKQYAHASSRLGPLQGDLWKHDIISSVPKGRGRKTQEPLYRILADGRIAPNATELVDKDFLSAMQGALSMEPASVVDGLKVEMGDLASLQAVIVADLPLKGATTQDDRMFRLIAAKTTAIKSLHTQVPMIDDMQVALLTNTPLDMVQYIRSNIDRKWELKELPQELDKWAIYHSQQTMASALKSPTVTMGGQGKQKLPPWAIAQQIDAELATTAELSLRDDIVFAAAQDSGSDWITQAAKQLVAPKVFDTLREGIVAFAQNAKMGSKFNTLDMMLRHFDEKLIATVTTAGQDLERVANNAIEGMHKQLQPTVRALSQDRASIVQLEYVRNALDELGPKDFDRARGLQITPSGKIVLWVADKPGAETVYLKYPSGEDIVLTSATKAFLEAVQPVKEELYAMQKLNAKLRGRDSIALSRNLWLPPRVIPERYQAFVQDTKTGKVTRIIGRNRDEFATAIGEFRSTNATAFAKKQMTMHLRTDKDLGAWMRLHNLHELEHDSGAIPTFTKQGIASHKITGTTEIIEDILQGLSNQYVSNTRNFMRNAHTDIFSKLDIIEASHEQVARAAGSKVFTTKRGELSPATAVKAGLLGTSLQSASVPIKMVDDLVSSAVDSAANKLQRGWQEASRHFAKGDYSPAAFDKLDAALNAAGIPTPWKDAVEFAIAAQPELKPVAKQLVSASSAVLTTLALRLFDVSHAVITTLSTPMILAGEVGMQKGVYGTIKELREVTRLWSAQAMNVGTMEANYWRNIMQEAKERGYVTRKTSEATENVFANLGTEKWWHRFQKSDGFGVFTKPSDWAETMTREMAYMMGYKLHMDRYFGASADEARVAANLFTNRIMGNYNSRQRPIFFQGAAGQAIGLFQTFMYTMGQNIYRYSENKSFNSLRLLFGGYAGMFGMEALPGYDMINQAIGQWSDNPEDYDITQTVYKAFGNEQDGHQYSLAEFLLYGAPSYLTQTAFWTRADMEPRLPLSQGGLPLPPAIGAVGSTIQFLTNTASKMGNAAMSSPKAAEVPFDVGRAALEGISMQAIFRPAARWAELIQGVSLDQKGEIVLSGEDVRGSWAGFARVVSSRPLKEQIYRNNRYRHRLYDISDQRKRRAIIAQARQNLRFGHSLSPLMAKYLEEGGAVSGWNQIINDLHLVQTTPGPEALLRELKKQPGILGIMEGYID